MANKVQGSLSIEKFFYSGNLTTAQRDVTNPNAPGAIIWNTTTGQPEVWNGTSWISFGGVPPVDSVNGQTGIVVLDGGDIAITPTGNQTATNTQAAIDALQAKIDTLNSQAADGYLADNSGGSAPANTVGADDSYFLDVSTGDVYGPKTAGVWPATPINNVFDVNLSNAAPQPVGGPGDATAGTSNEVSRADHVHEAPSIGDIAGPFGTAATAAEAGTDENIALVSDGAGGWVGKEIACAPYKANFVTGDWAAGTPNTFTVPVATHGLPFTAGDRYDVTVTNAAGEEVIVCTQTNSAGDVILLTDGATFPGRISIRQ